MNLWAIFYENLERLNEINNITLESFVTSLSNRNQSENSKVRKISSINQYVQWFNSNSLEKQIMIDKISLKTGSYLPETLSVSDITKMIETYEVTNFLNAIDDALLHAITIALHFFIKRKSVIFSE